MQISVQRNIRNFCDDVPYALIYLKKLLTAKGIIRNSQQSQFQDKVYCLARIIYGHLERIEELCAGWSNSIDPRDLATFLEGGMADFLSSTTRIIGAIEHMLKTESRNSKMGKVLKRRNQGDRYFRNFDWNDRPLATSTGAMEVLEDIEATIKVIHRFSITTGTGTNMSSMTGIIEARRSYVEFNHSNSLLEEFFTVLREEIQRGSVAFPESREEKTTEMNTSRGGWRAKWNNWRRPKPEALIGGL
jgi:hypothetical protein